MQIFQKRSPWLKLLLVIFGMAYFSTFSNLEISTYLKGYVAIVPLQILALIYVAYWFWKSPN